MRLHGVLISIYIILVMFFSSFETIGVTCVLVVFCNFVFFKKYLHFRAAFTMGEEVGVTFPGGWGPVGPCGNDSCLQRWGKFAGIVYQVPRDVPVGGFNKSKIYKQ